MSLTGSSLVSFAYAHRYIITCEHMHTHLPLDRVTLDGVCRRRGGAKWGITLMRGGEDVGDQEG